MRTPAEIEAIAQRYPPMEFPYQSGHISSSLENWPDSYRDIGHKLGVPDAPVSKWNNPSPGEVNSAIARYNATMTPETAAIYAAPPIGTGLFENKDEYGFDKSIPYDPASGGDFSEWQYCNTLLPCCWVGQMFVVKAALAIDKLSTFGQHGGRPRKGTT